MIKELLILIVMTVGFTSCNSESTSSEITSAEVVGNSKIEETVKVRSIKGQEAKGLIETRKDLIVLDVRTQEEYDAGHVKKALHIDFYSPAFSKHLQALDTDKPYLVYCAVGGRSSKAVGMMEEMGFKQLYEASEGFKALESAGVPVDKK